MCKTNTGKKIAFLVAVLLAVAIFAILAEPAEAAGVPSKIITFTDKKVYTAWWNNRATTPTFKQLDDAPGQTIYLYALVLDDDGNIMKGRTVQVIFNDTTFDHWEKNNWARHSDMVGNNTYFTTANNLNDTGTFGDEKSSDGLYTTTMGIPSSLLTDVQTSPRVDDQIRIKMTVRDTATGLNTTVYALVSWGKCHQTSTSNNHPSAHIATASGSDLCTDCHGGYEHFFEGISNTIPYDNLDVHYKVLGDSLPDSTEDGNGDIGSTYWAKILWNSTVPNGAVADISWKNRSGGGAVYCLFCHKDPAGTNVFDYGAADRSNLADRPSCSQSTSGYGGLSCHSTTEIEAATVIPWSQSGAVSSTNDTLVGINRQKAHNKTGIIANVSCTLCHTVPHSITMPNMSADITSSGSISNQCLTCHNITGGLNITSNGGTNVAHDGKTNCKNCHTESNKLDSHLVPVGVFGGKWCMDCHKINGKSPIAIDETVTNNSNANYIHYALNNQSAGTTNSSRICWGCHTNDSVVVNGIVNSTMLPASIHPDKYDQPRNCTSCHNSTASTNFSAPQTYRHTWYAANMKTTAVTYCTNCHGQNEMILGFNQSAATPTTSNESVSHYGRIRTDLEDLMFTGKYCQYCHQNESTVMGPFANPDNEVRSDHASQATTPSCGNGTCHNDGRLHENTVVLPNFTEATISTTCMVCHSTSNYSSHNNTLTCWDCHMGNVSSNQDATWIHPIQFIQYNGNFTGAKLTGATCYDCHKSSSVDNTTQYLSGKKAPKVNNQVHSNDPNNGTKWGDYWKYTPTTYQFASYEIVGGNGNVDPSHPFKNIESPSNEYMQLNETQTGRVYDVTLPALSYDMDFSSQPGGNWTSNTATSGVTGTVSASYDSATGNPAGSLKGKLTTSSTTGQHFGYIWWNYSFNYNPNSSQYKYTNASVDYSVTVASITYPQNVYLNLVKPSGAVVTLASSGPITANTGWLSLSNYSFSGALTENGSVTPYKLQLYAVLSGPKTSQVFTVNYDNVNLRIKEKVWNRYEMIINTTGVPVNGSSKLGMSYQVHKENTSLMIYNRTSGVYELLETLDKSVFYDYTRNISSANHILPIGDGTTGNVSVKFVDDDQSDSDTVSDKMHIRYLYVYTDRGLQYPCEQCHSPNKHYVNPTLGSPSKFQGTNTVNSTNLSNSTWCQQCHWQGASNYSDMVKEYNVTRNPPENIPPEISGNATYAPVGKPGYVNHSGSAYSNMNDSGCFGCHGKSGDTTTSQFIHNVQVGAGGNRKCVTCHNATTTNYKKIDVDALRNGMHANLKNASANVSNASNPIELACWACHGDGLYNNSDDHHPGTKTCDKCHTNTTGKLNYSNATKVYEHIRPGFITPEANITANSTASWSCADCHNNSINTTALINDNEADPINARTGHYGINRTGGKLMYSSTASKGNSEDCTYCHNGNSANMTKWGINTSTTKNLSNKGSHSSYTNTQCGGCHNYTDSSTFTFHAEEMNQGAGSGPDCKGCHNTSVSGTDKGHIDYPAFNTSIHGGINTTAGATNDPDNEPCWACHGSGNSEGHNTTGDASGKGKYTNPYVCADCHVSTGVRYAWATSKGALNVSEHFANGTKIKASYNATVTFSCLKCHQDKGEMLLSNGDADYNKTAWSEGGDNYNTTIGGNNSPYHYGAKRATLNGSAQNTDGYCNYCHSNSSSIFPYVNQHNKSIFEHTANTSADIKNTTSLNCNNAVCHGAGRIHNATLNKTVQTAWTSGQKDYCAPCHKPKPTGLANKSVYGQWHDPANSSSDNMTNCNYCHDSGSPGSTALSYSLNVHSDNLTYPTGTTTCVACHNTSSTYVKSRKILTHFPGASKDKGNTSLSGRTCELCHGIAGQSMHASGLVKKPNYGCADCHVSTATGPYWANQSFNSYIDTTTHDNTSTSNVTNCVWCHNNSNANASFHFTPYANGSVSDPKWGGWQAGNLVNCTNCHDSSYSNQAPFYAPAKPHAGTGNNTDECYSCHTSVNNYAAAPLAVHSVVQAPGNANCTKCHDIGGAASKEVDVAAMNKSDSIHLNLNSGASSGNATAPYAADSKRCWACHGDGTDKNEHDQARYKNPYKCEDCHTPAGSQSGKYPTFNVTEHFAGGTDIRAPGAAYCYDCHNKSEMVRANNDIAISSSNASAGHYGKKRILDGNDYPLVNTIAYCNKCHNNGTSVFPFADTANRTIANHSMNYNSTNPSCLDSSCHATGRIHNETLKMPKLQLPNSTYCTGCHTTKERHNSTGGANSGLNCTECHLNSSKSVHPARYLEYSGTTWSTYNSSATNCTSCHQGAGINGFSKAIVIPTPVNHSTNNYSGKLWGNYWNNNSQQDSCRYCHGNLSYHNTSGLGLVLTVKGTNTVRQGFTGGNWCANCHYNKAVNYSVSAFSPVPPEVTTSTTPNDPSVSWYNHSSDLASNYTDAKCKDCHDNALTSGATSLNFTHNLGAGGGGPDCAACHDAGKGNAMVSVDAIKASMHWNLKNASATDTTGNPANKICWACHQSDGTQPMGHPDKKSNPYNCTDCHKNASRPAYVTGALQVSNHYKSGTNITALTGSATNDTSCLDCHLLSEMVVSYTEPDADYNNNSLASHYGKNRSDMVAMGDDAYCNYCHSNGSTSFAFNKPHNKLIFEHTGNGAADIRNATSLNCTDCHTTNPSSYRIHNSTLKTPSASSWTAGKEDRCAPCHKTAGAGSSLKVNNSYHNTTTGGITDCGYCHNGDAMKAGNAPQNIHSDNLTTGGNSTYNNCYNCHQNGFASKVIIEHTNNTGANITNASMTCSKGGCHVSNKTHSSTLVKPAINNWTTGGNDYCAPCHNSSDSVNNATRKVYNQGHNPNNKTNDNITSCGNCHNASTPGAVPASFKLHDPSMTKSPVEPNASTCQGCHNTTTLYVGSGRQIFSHMPNASQYRGNTSTSSYTCEYCHNMSGKPSMHSAGMTRSNGTCETCHLNNTSPFKSTQKDINQLAGGMLNHSYNGSANTTCKMCHNASGRVKFHLSKYASGDIADPQDSNGNQTFADRATWTAGDSNDRGILVDCRDCHEKYNDTAPFNAPFFEANKTGINNQEHVGKNYKLQNCYVCHTSQDSADKAYTVHNVSIEPLSGGPNCTKCHDIGATDPSKAPPNMLVNFTAFNNSAAKHRNLTNVTAWGGSAVFGLIDTACWACHQSDGKQMERHPDLKDNTTLTGGSKAYRCADCHTIGGNVSAMQPSVFQNATKIYKHYPGAVFGGNKLFTNAVNCPVCHKNSKVVDINISAYSANIDAMATNISHYATRIGLIDTRDNVDSYGCTVCHGAGQSGNYYGNPEIIYASHNLMGGSQARCQKSCHNSNPSASTNITLHAAEMGINIGTAACFSSGCHTVPNTGGRKRR